ncbi:SDR family NAD(P)-dependent oxidoreductase [Leekyejoonella antrihumi]|uniref:SDR family oxidoreductase n=1 Tax=Leekyejoonella antrihumi TaxID=1660198 RepID=A0A563DZ21_9MICO|nr:SDR family oxidoreductase [Leekyejoonella antrihumi]TWP35477.1 SDR family oxidoreductase [Leekyejoonella antrihumi]
MSTDQADPVDLSGLVVVVTGAAGDGGAPAVRHLVTAGATVVAAGRSRERLDAVVQSASGGPGTAVASVVDLLDEPSTLAWGHELLETYGRIDGLLHLVGGWRGGKGIVESDLADWDFLHASIIRTLQHATRALHDPIKASPRGRLAIVSTTGLRKPRAKNAAYVSAKAGAEAWTLAVADSFSGSDAAAVVIRVMALLTPQMRDAKPDAPFKNFVAVDDLADQLVALWDRPADELNGTVR